VDDGCSQLHNDFEKKDLETALYNFRCKPLEGEKRVKEGKPIRRSIAREFGFAD
jgi:hypothetical protein